MYYLLFTSVSIAAELLLVRLSKSYEGVSDK